MNLQQYKAKQLENEEFKKEWDKFDFDLWFRLKLLWMRIKIWLFR